MEILKIVVSTFLGKTKNPSYKSNFAEKFANTG